MCKFDERNYANSHSTFDFNVKNAVVVVTVVVATTALSS